MPAMRCTMLRGACFRPGGLNFCPARPAVKPATARQRPIRRTAVVTATFNPPTVASTKQAFLQAYRRPVPGIFNGVLQELLVQQHFMRYAINYEYNEVQALGVVSVFEQILESLGDKERSEIFNAYIKALGEDPEVYRRDAAALEKDAAVLQPPEKLAPGDDLEIQRKLARIEQKIAAGKLAYNRFFAIGLFRLLEISGAKEPSALEALVKGLGVKPDAVNKDLLMYKNILSKLSAAKELMRDFMEREKRKQAEREEEKKAKAEKELAGEQV